MIFNAGQRRGVVGLAVPIASLTPASGVTYTDGFTGLDAETVSLFCGAISNNAAINNETGSVYIDYGNEHRKFSIGDQVSLSLNGTNYAFDIIGFNHDDLTDAAVYGKETATGKAGMTLQMLRVITGYWMNTSNTNNGGWASSFMRTTNMPKMKNWMPSDWQGIIKTVNKYTGIAGGSASENSRTDDDCFLLSENEIFGAVTFSNSYEGDQYAYYKAGNSKVKTKPSETSGIYWWQRSPRSGNFQQFCGVTNQGTPGYIMAYSDYGVAFGFCV